MIAAVVVIVGIGGCVAGKLIEKTNRYRERRDHEMTNEVENFAQGLLEQYRQETGDQNARMIVNVTTNFVLSTDPQPEFRLQCSTNLADWVNMDGAGGDLREIARVSNAPAVMFFRVKP